MEANEPLAEAMILLGHDPWHDTPYHPDNPTATSDNSCTATATAVHLILETRKRIVVERVLWLEALG